MVKIKSFIQDTISYWEVKLRFEKYISYDQNIVQNMLILWIALIKSPKSNNKRKGKQCL